MQIRGYNIPPLCKKAGREEIQELLELFEEILEGFIEKQI